MEKIKEYTYEELAVGHRESFQVTVTEQMMQQGMSVDTKALQNVFRDIASHAGAAVEDMMRIQWLLLRPYLTEEGRAELAQLTTA